MFLLDLIDKDVTGKDADAALGRAHITVNKNSIPFDTASPFKPSGIRIGTPAVTTRGMKVEDVEKVADFIHEALQNHGDDAKLVEIREKVYALNRDFPLPE